jgi:hypothetical protein
MAAPADEAAAVTKSDATILPTTRGLYIGTTGDVAVTMARTGAAIVFTAVPGGVILPIRVTQVLSTGTTASNIVALW